MLSLTVLEKDVSQALLLGSLACGSITLTFTRHSPSVQAYVHISPFYKDASHIELGATLLQCDLN